MTAITPNEAALSDRSATRDVATAGVGQRLGAAARGLWHPLTAICAVQAALSLALVWTNTAYIDEADYLWVGHLVIRNWLHGAPWPAALVKNILSGSPAIYPPIGALADNVAGLAGARVLSMLFMLGATVLLYSATSRLLGRGAAVIAAALWAVSEPALRLTYATYDPLSVFLTTLSAWLIVKAAGSSGDAPAGQHSRRAIVFGALGAVALGLANATAYSGIVINPVVVAFAFCVWWPVMTARRALAYTASFAAVLVASFALIMVGTGSWAGTANVFNRQTHDHESLTLVVHEIWGYSGFLIALALLGVLIAFRLETRQRASLVTLLGCAVFAAPAAQFHYGTAWSADKHVAYGFWFAAMAAGYGCAKVIAWPAGTRTRLIAAACAVAFIYPAVYGFSAAWQRYHLWPNSSAFVAALRPVVSHTPGLIYVPGHEANVAQYYLPQQGNDWQRWNAQLALNPASLPVPVPRDKWASYYKSQVARGTYGVLALFYSTTFTASSALPGSVIANGKVTQRTLLGLVSDNSDEPGVGLLTEALERSRLYKLVRSGPYDITNINQTHSYGVFAIWKRVG
ncbi:MAG TPA: hypothetical protein VN695_15520 [Streptosporangiaceae bacterium]|nr:hypothetical protein [Streptosporangiaceae bacterium]